MKPEPVAVAWEVAEDEAMKKVVAQRHRGRHAAARALGPRRGRRAEAGPLVLVPLPRRRRGQPGRPHPHAARRRRHARAAEVRVRLVPALRAGAVHRLRADGQGRPRPGVPPGRLHLRVPRPGQAGPQAQRADDDQDQDAGRLPRAAHAVSRRPAAAGHARPLPVVRHLGRPRVRQQLRQRHLRRSSGRGRRPTRWSSWCSGRRPTRRTTR